MQNEPLVGQVEAAEKTTLGRVVKHWRLGLRRVAQYSFLRLRFFKPPSLSAEQLWRLLGRTPLFWWFSPCRRLGVFTHA